ncbi:tetratricopeptide repeat protein [Lutibacter citreus]|uniref:tetratricopeptide repeat protein n=1 Tax=Lutibacter citreus TaxID=2138210 RepID=UPI000DBE4AB9|nr:hypothetical protein [Lutibacter citreus]
MYRGILNIFIVFGMVFISTISVAQNNDLQSILTGEKGQNEEMNSLEFQEHFFEALKFSTTNNFKKAIEELEVCYQIDTLNLAVEFEFSKNYLALQKYNEATIFIDKALEKESNNRYLLKHKVAILKAQINYKEAIEIQKKLVLIKPSYSNELVLLYIQNKEYDKAENLIDEIEKKALGTLKLRRFKAYLKTRKKYNDKIVETSKISSKDLNIDTLIKKYNETKDYKILLEILSYDLKSGLFEKLYLDSKAGIELYPAQPILYQLSGFALNKLNRYDEAIEMLTIGIDFVFDNNKMELNYYNELIISYEGINNKELVLKYKQKAEKLKGKN